MDSYRDLSGIPPDACPDATSFGFDGVIIGRAAAEIRQGAGELGTLDVKRARPDRPLLVALTERFCDGDGAAEVGRALIDLHVAEVGAGLRILPRSSIRLNPLEILRGCMGEEAAGPRGFGGAGNLVHPSGAGADLRARWPGLIAEAVELALEGVSAAVAPGSFRRGDIWLKSFELCADTETSDAVADVRVLQRTTLAGSVAGVSDCYRTCADDRGAPVVRFFRKATGPAHKLYAKARDVRRAEIAAHSRKAVALLTGRRRAHASGPAAATLALAAVRAAAADLADLQGHAASALAAAARPAELVMALAEIARLAGGESRSPTPASPQTRAAALDALDSFLTRGCYDARGQNRNHALPALLLRLAASGDTLVRHPGSLLFYLHPRFGRPLLALSSEQPAGALEPEATPGRVEVRERALRCEEPVRRERL